MRIEKFIIFFLIVLSLSGFFSELMNRYYLPQVLAGLLLLLTLGISVLSRVNEKKWWLVGMAAMAVVALFDTKQQWSVPGILLASSFFIGVLISQSGDRLGIWFKKSVIAASVIQAALAIWQFLGGKTSWLQFKNGEPVATVGNSDFLATILAVGLLLSLDLIRNKKILWTVILTLFTGLLATKSLGTVLILSTLLMSLKMPKTAIILASIGLVASPLILSGKITGRIHLVIVSIHAWLDAFWTGHGLGQFQNAYFSSVKELMGHNQFRARFSPWISELSDAHNLPLQWAVEFGIVGFLSAIGLLIMAWRISTRVQEGHRMAILLLMGKSLYTVVLASTQGSFLFFALLGLGLQRKTPRCPPNVIAVIALACSAFFIPAVLKYIHAEHRLFAGMQYLRIHMYDLAQPALASGLRMHPENTDLLLANAFLKSKTRQCEEAKSDVSKAVLITQSMDTYKRGGKILLECRYLDEAHDLFSDLHRVFSEHRTTMMQLAWTAYYKKDLVQARHWASKVLSSQPRRRSYSDERNLREARKILNETKAGKGI